MTVSTVAFGTLFARKRPLARNPMLKDSGNA
jgi:hypothetical protein